jgi:DNA-binding NtrC family response regulator
MLKQILLVDPDAEALHLIHRALQTIADVEACTDFSTARTRLLDNQPDLLITNLRLREYNGLHLVYLASATGLKTRSIVYVDHEDPLMARETQAAGAFFESRQRLPYALPSYVRGELPARDRRDPATFDRRRVFRAGRRAADVAGLR